MNMLKDEEIHLKFLLGQSVYVDGIGEFHSPLLDEIVNLTELVYNQSISALLFNKENLESQEETKEYTDFQIVSSIVYHDSSFRELFFCGLNLHFNKEPILHEQGFIYFDEPSEDTVLTEEKYEYVKKLVRIANNVAESEPYDAANDAARKLIEKIKKRNRNNTVKPKQTMNLHSIISAVGWKAKSFEFINHLNIYQLYDGLGRLNIIDNFNFTMSGIYAGTVNPKEVKMPEINWANIIKMN